jgi:hypothetical protein
MASETWTQDTPDEHCAFLTHTRAQRIRREEMEKLRMN